MLWVKHIVGKLGRLRQYISPLSQSYREDKNGKACKNIWMFPKIVGKPPKWMVFFRENPIEMDDLGVPLFSETPIYTRT